MANQARKCASNRSTSDAIAGEYDLAHLQAFHRYLFAGLYEWAGDLRTVVLAKTDLFCLRRMKSRRRLAAIVLPANYYALSALKSSTSAFEGSTSRPQ